MKDRLTKEEVLHVANLARIEVTEEEIEKYQINLKKLLDDIERINEIDAYDSDMLICPIDHKTPLREDKEEEMLDAKEVLKNVPRKSGNYIEVPVVINE